MFSVLTLVAVAVAGPAYPLPPLGCPYGCRLYGPDIARCVDSMGTGGRLANMNTCDEVQYCWRDAVGGWYCDQATCEGTQCYYV